MKKSTALLSLLLVFGGLCTQSQLFAMQRGRTVAKDTRSQDARAKLQQRAQAKKEELAKQKELATSFLEEKEFVESAEQLAQVNKALKESEDRMARAFGSDATFSAGEKKDGSMQQSLFKKYFCLKLPTQIALLLQFPKAFDQEFCLKNPVFIQKLLARPEPEIQELGQVAFAIRESGIYSQSFEQKFKTFKTLFNRMVSSQGAQDHHHYAAKLCKLTQGYYKYLYTCSTSETTETDRQYYRDLEQLARKYKDALSETNREYQSTLAKLPTSLKLPASLKPRLEPKKLEASSASAASAAASQPKQKTTTKKKAETTLKKEKNKNNHSATPAKTNTGSKKTRNGWCCRNYHTRKSENSCSNQKRDERC